MRTVRDISLFQNVPIIVRAALNIPIDNGAVVDDYRLRQAVPTIEFLATRGARVILISHMGEKGTETLAQAAQSLGGLVSNVSFCSQTIGAEARAAVRDLLPGHVLVLENLRRDPREVGNDLEFAKELAALGDIFVQDSFDTCHRSHASIVTLPQLLPAYAGLQVEKEVTALSSALTPVHPSLAIIGGAKFSTKEPVLDELLTTYDHVFVGGALANDFLKMAGHPVGKSLVSNADSARIQELLQNPKIILPIDSLVVPEEALGALDLLSRTRIAGLEEVKENELILDHGPRTIAQLSSFIAKAKTVLWNGPLGNYEHGFVQATDAIARAIAASGAHSVVGGGDTVASIENLGLISKFGFVSTGGGAMIELLAHGTLPGIQALENQASA